MTSNKRESILKFEIKSLDPAKPTTGSVPAAEGLASELQAQLEKRYPGAAVTIRRAEGIPGVPEVQELLLHVDWHTVKTAAEGAIASFVTTEFLKLMKTKLRNVFVKRVPGEGASAGTLPSASAPPKKKGRLPRGKKTQSKTAKKNSRGKRKSRSSRSNRKR